MLCMLYSIFTDYTHIIPDIPLYDKFAFSHSGSICNILYV